MADTLDELRRRREELAAGLVHAQVSRDLAPTDLIDRAVKSIADEIARLDEEIKRWEEFTERENLSESPMARLLYAVAAMFQYDYWYIEDADEFRSQVKQVEDRLAREGYRVVVVPLESS